MVRPVTFYRRSSKTNDARYPCSPTSGRGRLRHHPTKFYPAPRVWVYNFDQCTSGSGRKAPTATSWHVEMRLSLLSSVPLQHSLQFVALTIKPTSTLELLPLVCLCLVSMLREKGWISCRAMLYYIDLHTPAEPALSKPTTASYPGNTTVRGRGSSVLRPVQWLSR